MATQGTFIPAGNAYDAYVAVGRALSSATVDVLIVDPYADAKLLQHYAVQTPENTALRLFCCWIGFDDDE